MNPQKDLGPCSITYNSVDLGSTLGGAKFRYTEESRPVNEDQKGVTNVDEIKVGASCEAEVVLTRSTLAQLSKVIGGNTYVGGVLSVSNPINVSMYDNAKVLILKPIIAGVPSTTPGTWLTISKAYPKVDLEILYNNEGQRVYKVIFKAFPDASTGLIWKIGE
jgi:hypothetical protein